MPRKYAPELRERAVGMVLEREAAELDRSTTR